MKKNIHSQKSYAIQSMIIMIIILATTLFSWNANVQAAPGAIAQVLVGSAVSAKTEATIKAEKELDSLIAFEKQIKEQISEATINRTKLLSQKRAELRDTRKKRDDAINQEISIIKAGKERQAALIKELKAQLALAKKNKYAISINSLELSIKQAEAKLADYNSKLKNASSRLTESYNIYKSAYNDLTRCDAELKKIIDSGNEFEKKIKNQKEDFKNTKNEYNQAIKNKNYVTAERLIGSLLSIQSGINKNYENILEIKLSAKRDYYQMVVNYRV